MYLIQHVLRVGVLAAALTLTSGGVAAASQVAGPASGQNARAASPARAMTFIGEARSSVSAKQAFALAETDARSQAAAAGVSDCKVTDYYTLLENYPGFPPSWYANVTLTCAG